MSDVAQRPSLNFGLKFYLQLDANLRECYDVKCCYVKCDEIFVTALANCYIT